VTENSTPSRWTGLGEALVRFALACVAAAAALAGIAAIFALLTGHDTSASIAVTYYIVGAALFVLGVFPSGGFSLVRGTMTQRRPLGPRDEPIFLVGLVLFGLGVLLDIYPF